MNEWTRACVREWMTMFDSCILNSEERLRILKEPQKRSQEGKANNRSSKRGGRLHSWEKVFVKPSVARPFHKMSWLAQMFLLFRNGVMVILRHFEHKRRGQGSRVKGQINALWCLNRSDTRSDKVSGGFQSRSPPFIQETHLYTYRVWFEGNTFE